MGADIGLSSLVGEGSTFWIELPVTESQERPSEAPVAAGWVLGSGAEPATVLYIEDNPSNLQLVRSLLSRLPHIRLLTATSGRAGLELAQRSVPDLVLLDLGLPDISGAEVLARLRADAMTGTIPVVVVSADATGSQRRRLLAAGAAAYLTKPLEVGLFFSTVEQTLRANPEQRPSDQSRTTLELRRRPPATPANRLS